PDRHTASPLEVGQSMGSAPVALLPLAPGAIGELAWAVPAFTLGARFHGAVAGALRRGVCGRGGHRGALEHGIPLGQQAALIRVAQGQLHLTPSDVEVYVDAGWGLRERRRRGRRLCGLAGCLSTVRCAVALRLDQLVCAPGNGRAQPVLTQLMRCFLIVTAVAVTAYDVVHRAAARL